MTTATMTKISRSHKELRNLAKQAAELTGKAYDVVTFDLYPTRQRYALVFTDGSGYDEATRYEWLSERDCEQYGEVKRTLMYIINKAIQDNEKAALTTITDDDLKRLLNAYPDQAALPQRQVNDGYGLIDLGRDDESLIPLLRWITNNPPVHKSEDQVWWEGTFPDIPYSGAE